MSHEPIVEAMLAYLKHERASMSSQKVLERQNVQKIIEYFDASKGQCFGIATFWAFCSLRSDESKEGQFQPKYGIEFFNKISDMLLKRKPDTSFTDVEKLEIQYFVDRIIELQGGLSRKRWLQQSLNGVVVDTHERKLVSERPFKGGRGLEGKVTLPKPSLARHLKQLIKPGIIYSFSSYGKIVGHALSIYQLSVYNLSVHELSIYDQPNYKLPVYK